MIIALLLVGIVGAVAGFFGGFVLGERRAIAASNETLELVLQRAASAERALEREKDESTKTLRAEREQAQERMTRTFDMASVVVSEARQTIAESRHMMAEAVDITKQATSLLFPVQYNPDEENGPVSVGDADRQRAREQAQSRTIDGIRSRA